MNDFDLTILQVAPALEEGGVERTTAEIAAGVVNAGGRALVASRGGRLVDTIEAAGGATITLPLNSKNPAVMIANAKKLANIVRKESVSVIHARSRAPAWSALWAARSTGTPFVTTYHGDYAGRSSLKRLYNSVMARGDLVIANSAYTARRIHSLYAHSKKRLMVIPRGVDVNAFSPSAVAGDRLATLGAQWGVGAPSQRNGQFLVLLPARLTAWKGHRLAIQAAGQMVGHTQHQALRSLLMVFCGDLAGREAYVKDLKAEAASCGMADKVKFVGHCDDMAAAYALSDVVLAPSTRPEAFGRTAVEAAAMEKIIIAADHGGARETVDDGRTGILFAPGDVVGLAEALEQALAMAPDDRSAMEAAARRRAIVNFSTSAMVRSTLEAYVDMTSLT